MFRFAGDDGGRRIDFYTADVEPLGGTGGRYIPVSLLTTPPTLEHSERPYGEIVNEDFYRFRNQPPAHQPVTSLGGPRPRGVVNLTLKQVGAEQLNCNGF